MRIQIHRLPRRTQNKNTSNEDRRFTLSLVALGIAAQFVPREAAAGAAQALARLPAWAQGAFAAAGIAAIDALGPDGVAPFIYFQF